MIVFIKYIFLVGCISGFLYWFMVMSEGRVERNSIKFFSGLFGVGCMGFSFAIWYVIDWQLS